PTRLSDEQIQNAVFAVLRNHNDDKLWRALTYEKGPYDVTFPNLALLDIARAIERIVRGEGAV
ncbi:hypothetical protein IAI36_11620, partial [Streptococcus pseudopneumoniae]|uniref:hypothetical protein n=1 Tax=Streptococcus pseudopneumoniae TaxID=257758 RepID=UPI0018B0D7C8